MKKTILLIEDDYDSLFLLQEYLNEFKIELINESTGSKGLETFKKIKNTLNMVILDIRLPDADGITIQRLMHSMRPELPIIAFTALHAEIRNRCINDGFNNVLEKPLDFKKLKNILDIYL